MFYLSFTSCKSWNYSINVLFDDFESMLLQKLVIHGKVRCDLCQNLLYITDPMANFLQDQFTTLT